MIAVLLGTVLAPALLGLSLVLSITGWVVPIWVSVPLAAIFAFWWGLTLGAFYPTKDKYGKDVIG